MPWWGRNANGLYYKCVSCIHVYICKVDYMMVNPVMYAFMTLNYNKVMHIISE